MTASMQEIYIPSGHPPAADAQNHNVIQHVVVFTRQALIKRQVTVAVEAGLVRVLIGVESQRLDPESVQGVVYGSGEVFGIQHRVESVTSSGHPEADRLETEKRRLEYEQSTQQRRKDQLEKKRRYLDSITTFAKVEVPAEIQTHFPSVENLGALMGFLDEHYAALDAQLVETEKALDGLKRELDAINENLGRHNKPKQAQQHFIEVLFQSASAQTLKIEASYLVQQASWKPIYKVNVSEALDTVDLTLMAQINQTTGEDWSDVQVTVTNAVPLSNTRLPDPASWYLSEYLPPRARVRAASMKLGSGEIAPPEAAENEAVLDVFDDVEMTGGGDWEPAAEVTQAAVKESELACEFALPIKVSIDSGGGQMMLPLQTQSLSGQFYYFTAPASSTDVALVCTVAADEPLMAGRMNLHFGGQFIGSSQLPEKAPGEEWILNLGADPKVRVGRRTITDKRSETFLGMMDRSSIAREMAYTITVENTKTKPVKLQIVDRIPVARTDRIQVKEVTYTVAPTQPNWKQREGVQMWEFTLAPGQSQELGVRFFVKYPKDFTVAGL